MIAAEGTIIVYGSDPAAAAALFAEVAAILARYRAAGLDADWAQVDEIAPAMPDVDIVWTPNGRDTGLRR